MNKIVEYIISAKDATAKAINSALARQISVTASAKDAVEGPHAADPDKFVVAARNGLDMPTAAPWPSKKPHIGKFTNRDVDTAAGAWYSIVSAISQKSRQSPTPQGKPPTQPPPGI